MDDAITRWTQKHPIVSSVLLVGLSVGVALAIASQLHGKPREMLQSAAVTLLFVALVGGLIKIFLDDFQRSREARAEQARFISAVLADLKSVYDRVERARTVIAAHQSALTYGKEMRDLIDARVQLRNVIRALDSTSAIHRCRLPAIKDQVVRMECYLKTLTDEFRENYKEISGEQSLYEARVKKRLDAVDDSTTLPRNEPWERLARLKRLSDFIEGDVYEKEFGQPLDVASHQLREELRAQLGLPSTDLTV